MRSLMLFPVLTLALAACSDAPNPTEAARPSDAPAPLFSTVSGSGYTAIGLGTLGDSWSGALAINDAGQVAGWSYTASGERHAFVWDAASGMQDLGTLGGSFSRAHCINDAGQVAGYSSTASGYAHAFVWDAASGIQQAGPVRTRSRSFG